MLSIDQVNPNLQADQDGQCWVTCSWFWNSKKKDTNPYKLLKHMDHLVKHYNMDKANAVHKQFKAVEDVTNGNMDESREDIGDENLGIIKKEKAVVKVCYCCRVLLIVCSK